MESLVRTLFDQLFFLGTDDFLTPPVCMAKICQQLNYLPRDMLGSSCVSLGVFGPLALGVRLFFLDVLLAQLSGVASAISTFEATRFTALWKPWKPFSKRFSRLPQCCKSRQDKLDAVALVQCGCDIALAGTRKRDCHFFGDVVARGFTPVKFVFVCPDRLCDCRSWAFLVVSCHHFQSTFCSRQHMGLACVQQVSSRIVASVWSSRQHNSTTPSIWSRHRCQTRNCQITGLSWGCNGCRLRVCGNAHIGGADTGPTFHVLLLWTCLARHP